ncbi:MAG TPA: DUF4097 family beta strand repeat-containing protein [Naasia sp.]|jgi:DUF4097 and DUF4098 domain-containing protein YvlB
MPQEKWVVTGPKVIDLPAVTSVKVSLLGGRIDVIGTDEPTARVEIGEVSGRDLLVRIDGGSLEIDHPQLRWDDFLEAFRAFRGRASTTVSLLVPRNATLKLGVVSADALISGMASPTRLSTVSGSIMLDGSEGHADLNSVGGTLSVRGHRGGITAHTVSGDVSATGALTSFSCDGVSGDVFIDATGVPERIETNTVSGGTTIRLADGVPARFTVNTVSGTAQLDGRVIKGIHGRGESWSTVETGPWTEVRSNSVSGDIVVVRAVPAEEAR